jgi:hypothetical protein
MRGEEGIKEENWRWRGSGEDEVAEGGGEGFLRT